MGTQKRYAEGNERRRINREAEAHALVRRSLSEAERGSEPVKRASSVEVKAWIDFGNASTQIRGLAVAWTTRCVLVIWTDSHDQRHECWVWAGAVERVEGKQPLRTSTPPSGAATISGVQDCS